MVDRRIGHKIPKGSHKVTRQGLDIVVNDRHSTAKAWHVVVYERSHDESWV
jgi:hypothetical protein